MLPLFATGVIDIGVKFDAGIVDTGGKFAAGVVDTGGKFAAGVVILAAILQLVHLELRISP